MNEQESIEWVEAMEFVKNAYRVAIESLLDEPGSRVEAQRAVIHLYRVGRYFGLPFWGIAEEVGTDHEVRRLRELVDLGPA